MEDWEKLSAFGDIGELEHICGILDEYAAGDSWDGMLVGVTDENSPLVRRLNIQYEATQKLLDGIKPNLFRRTWYFSVLTSLFVDLDEVSEKPTLLRSYLPGIILNLHKALIAAYDVYGEESRNVLLRRLDDANKNVVATVTEAVAKSFSARQSSNAKGPRNRNCDPGAGKPFVKAVKNQSKKRNYVGGWSWLENDAEFEGFDIVSVSDDNVTYRFNGKTYKPLKKETFIRYWNEKKKGK